MLYVEFLTRLLQMRSLVWYVKFDEDKSRHLCLYHHLVLLIYQAFKGKFAKEEVATQ